MARFSLPKPKEPVVPVTPIIGGSPAASKVNVYTKPTILTKTGDTKWDWMNPKKYSQEEGLDVL